MVAQVISFDRIEMNILLVLILGLSIMRSRMVMVEIGYFFVEHEGYLFRVTRLCISCMLKFPCEIHLDGLSCHLGRDKTFALLYVLLAIH